MYPASRRGYKKPDTRSPVFRTFPVILTFDDGSKIKAEVTVKNKPRWAGQLEQDIIHDYNANAPMDGRKVVSVKVYRNSRDGGFMADNMLGRVIEVY